jgi:ribosomal protein S3
MAKKMRSEDMWAVWNDDFGFYVDTRLNQKDMIEKHTSDLGMTWEECKRAGDKVVRVVITAAQPALAGGRKARVRSGKSKSARALRR